MLSEPGPKSTPLLDALRETFIMTDTTESIPRFIKKAQGILRRDANEIRRANNLKELEDV